MKPRDLQRMKVLADTIYEAELAKIRGNAAAIAATQAQVEKLREARRVRADETRALGEPDPAQLASADLQWDRWTGGHMHRLQAERAKLEVEAESLRQEARVAFGRGQALDAISEKLRAEARKRATRRAEA